MQLQDRIYVAGHRGLVGSAICRALRARGYTNLLTPSRQELDLENAQATESFFQEHKPDYVFLAAAKVGGILANDSFPADFLRSNIEIQNNVIEASYRAGVKRLLFLGSSCIYPKMAPQPLSEDSLLTGPLEPTNRAYAIAKIAGIELCWGFNRQHGTRYLAAMPTNLYGPNDNFDLQSSHVLPALIRKTVEAQRNDATHVTVWGTGEPRREFLHSDDLADACLFLMNLSEEAYASFLSKDRPPLINIGTGVDLTIRQLAEMVADLSGFKGDLVFDATKPDGTPRKLLDVGKLNALGWFPSITLRDGVRATVDAWKEKALPSSSGK